MPTVNVVSGKSSLMNPFVIRIVSAFIAVLALLFPWFLWGNLGLKLVVAAGVPMAAYEIINILFSPDDSKSNKFVFFFFIHCIFALSGLYPQYSSIIFAFFAICFCLFSLLTQRKFENLDRLTSFQAKSILGFFYVGLLPSFLLQILDLPHGSMWFFALLGIVFAGDSGAYIVGMFFGQHKLMPKISPKKTVEGAIGGIAASLITGLIFRIYLPQIPAYSVLILSLAVAIVAQFGDLFESLLKRVADVKDSGSLMPGHGGILDRVDGVLFASPILLFGALVLEGLLR